ncbi:MAG: polyprenol monophosphomannose synthase [Actinomycetota bacterium]
MGTSDHEGRALVVVPTYNERHNISECISRLLARSEVAGILVVDDSSPDGTAGAVEALAPVEGRVHTVVRPAKLGLGTAYVTGFRWGIERGYSALVEMDADLSHDPNDVARLLAALAHADLVIGSRYVAGGSVENWGILRRFLSRGANLFVRILLGYSVRDSTSGFRAFKTSTLQDISYETLRSQGYGFQIEITRRVYRSGGRIAEIPITFVERASGRSKMTLRIILEAAFNVVRWSATDRLRR